MKSCTGDKSKKQIVIEKKTLQKIKMFKYCERRGGDSNRMVSD